MAAAAERTCAVSDAGCECNVHFNSERRRIWPARGEQAEALSCLLEGAQKDSQVAMDVCALPKRFLSNTGWGCFDVHLRIVSSGGAPETLTRSARLRYSRRDVRER